MTAPTAPEPHIAKHSSLRRLRLLAIVMVAFLTTGMVIGVIAYLSVQHDRSVSRTLNRTGTTAKTVGSQAEQTFRETFRVLEGIADIYRHEREHDILDENTLLTLMAEKLEHIPAVKTFVILDENNDGVAAGRTFPLDPKFPRPERDIPRPPPITMDGFTFSEIYENARPQLTPGSWLLPVSMDVTSQSGEALGRVLAVIDVSSFETFYKSLDVGSKGTITLWSANGILVASNNTDRYRPGHFEKSALDHYQILRDEPNATTETIIPGTDGEITVRCALANAPLFISITVHADDFLASWRGGRNTFAVAMPIVILAMIAFSLIITFQLKRLERNEAELRKAKASAEDANETKSRFLAHMSHEFRTPLNAIMGFAEIIKNKMLGGEVPKPYVAYADHIHRSGEHLLHIVNDILDMSKIESGAQALRQETIDMHTATLSAISFVEGIAAQKDVTVHVEFNDTLPRVIGDERFIRQVLINLLSNAVKFSPAGEIVRVLSRHEEGKSLEVSVADSGPGVDPAVLRRLGEPFLQSDPAISQTGQGTGLGLSICKRYMDLLGGELTIYSAADQGTTATIRFPSHILDASTS